MDDEKKIEDLIYSIGSLIDEAKQENKLLEQIENKIENYDSIKRNILTNTGTDTSNQLNKDQNLEQLNRSKFYDWKAVKFLKNNLQENTKINLEKKILQIFDIEINHWIRSNLKNIIQTEFAKFSSKIISEKLK
tara:strand:- start:6 stop:407 length:402 start_codon:yes stop_codon:yes gene_type:complete